MVEKKQKRKLHLLKRIAAKLKNAFIIYGIVTVLILSGEILADFYYFARNGFPIVALYNRVKTNIDEMHIFDDRTPFEIELQKASKARYQSYSGVKRLPFDGSFINVDTNGIRSTHNYVNNSADTTIFMFGGSTMWGGDEVEDRGTIPSHLANQLYLNGFQNCKIVNFGESGKVAGEEMNRLILELKKGNIPDIVLFYDGFNEVFSVINNEGLVGFPFYERMMCEWYAEGTQNDFIKIYSIIQKHSSLLTLLKNISLKINNRVESDLKDGGFLLTKKEFSSDKKLSEQIILNYENHVKIVNALANEYGFNAIFFWQPTLFSKDKLSLDEEIILNETTIPKKIYTEVYEKVIYLTSQFENFYDLQNEFDGHNETIFSDECHIGSQGNLIISKAMMRYLVKSHLK